MTLDEPGSAGIAADQLGKYRLVATLGQGGMGTVHLAVASGLGQFRKLLVAKELRQDLTRKPGFVTMFMDEARLAARLEHPNVVHTFEMDQDGERYFLAMEYLDGQPLSTLISRLRGLGGLPLRMQLEILSEMLAGLHYAHELRDYDGTPLHVVHRDVSPQNVFVTYHGQVKLVDFGVAKAATTSTATEPGIFKGKFAYAAPEQIMGRPVDARSDVFSVGVMLWEAIARRRFSPQLPTPAAFRARLSGQEPRIAEVMPDVNPLLAAICDQALSVDPDDRFPSAEAFRDDLQEYMQVCEARVEAAEIGRLMRSAFAQERRTVHALIEQAMKHDASASTVASLPFLSADNEKVSTTVADLSGLANVLQESDDDKIRAGYAQSTAGLLPEPPAPSSKPPASSAEPARRRRTSSFPPAASGSRPALPATSTRTASAPPGIYTSSAAAGAGARTPSSGPYTRTTTTTTLSGAASVPPLTASTTLPPRGAASTLPPRSAASTLPPTAAASALPPRGATHTQPPAARATGAPPPAAPASSPREVSAQPQAHALRPPPPAGEIDAPWTTTEPSAPWQDSTTGRRTSVAAVLFAGAALLGFALWLANDPGPSSAGKHQASHELAGPETQTAPALDPEPEAPALDLGQPTHTATALDPAPQADTANAVVPDEQTHTATAHAPVPQADTTPTHAAVEQTHTTTPIAPTPQPGSATALDPGNQTYTARVIAPEPALRSPPPTAAAGAVRQGPAPGATALPNRAPLAQPARSLTAAQAAPARPEAAVRAAREGSRAAAAPAGQPVDMGQDLRGLRRGTTFTIDAEDPYK